MNRPPDRRRTPRRLARAPEHRRVSTPVILWQFTPNPEFARPLPKPLKSAPRPIRHVCPMAARPSAGPDPRVWPIGGTSGQPGETWACHLKLATLGTSAHLHNTATPRATRDANFGNVDTPRPCRYSAGRTGLEGPAGTAAPSDRVCLRCPVECRATRGRARRRPEQAAQTATSPRHRRYRAQTP